MVGTQRFDLVLSDIVLQHIRPAVALKYVDEFLRILRPGGIAVFFLPGRFVRRGWAPWVVATFNPIRYGTSSTLDYGVQSAEVVERLRRLGAEVLEIRFGPWLYRGQSLPRMEEALSDRLWMSLLFLLTDRWEDTHYLVRKG